MQHYIMFLLQCNYFVHSLHWYMQPVIFINTQYSAPKHIYATFVTLPRLRCFLIFVAMYKMQGGDLAEVNECIFKNNSAVLAGGAFFVRVSASLGVVTYPGERTGNNCVLCASEALQLKCHCLSSCSPASASLAHDSLFHRSLALFIPVSRVNWA